MRLRGFFVFALTLTALLAVPAKPRLEVRAYPKFGFAPLQVQIHAEMVNPPDDWLCPEVTWVALDGSDYATMARQLSDCDDKTEPETTWSKWYNLPESPAEGWVMTVELRRNNKLLARQSVNVRVLG